MNLSRIINPPEEEQEVSSASNPPALSSPSHPLSSIPEPPEEVEEDDEIFEEDLPPVSFIVCMEAKEEGKVCYVSPTVIDLLGWDPDKVVGTPASLYCHPDDVGDLYRAYQEMISEDKAACLMYHRIPYGDKSKGYMLCSVTISRAGPHLIGACSPATSATKAMHYASTASEVIVITPSAARLAFRRWNVPSAPPMSASSSGQSKTSRESTPESPEAPSSPSSPKNETEELTQSLRHLTLTPPSQPEVAKRVALILNRFSTEVPIIFCTNDDILLRSVALGRPFFDFVTKADEIRIRQAIDMVKSWGVSERGNPADGGFAFNRFHMYLRGRDSSSRPEGESARKRRSFHAMAPIMGPESSDSARKRNRSKQRLTAERGVSAPTKDVLLVDAIFSPQSDGIIVIIRPALQTGVKV
ncbi:hypothetical protein ACEPAG_8584 [Sanghuangporus baumii]